MGRLAKQLEDARAEAKQFAGLSNSGQHSRSGISGALELGR